MRYKVLRSLWRMPVLFGLVASSLWAGSTTYQVTFDATWSAATHPGTFPSGAHFSPLVGATHSDNVIFWEPGGLATPGIESMAETGGTFVLRGEVQSAIDAGTARQILLGSGAGSPATTSFTFPIESTHPLVTLVTMIAPSPDWFVGVHGLNLRSDGKWLSDWETTLFPYDAGSDGGPSFTSPNQDTNPKIPIHRLDTLSSSPFDGLSALGRFSFQLRTLATDFDGNGRVGAEDYTIWRDTVGSSSDLRADANGDGLVDQLDFESWEREFGASVASNFAATASTISTVPEPNVVGAFMGLTVWAIGVSVRRKTSSSHGPRQLASY